MLLVFLIKLSYPVIASHNPPGYAVDGSCMQMAVTFYLGF
jgi:hypothetical protein